MQGKRELTESYLALLEQVRHLLTRQNLTNNNYLFKHMKPNLTLPLFIIAQERKISSITNNEQDLIMALQESGLARVINGREVVIIQWPTIKIHLKYQDTFPEIEGILKQSNKRYAVSERLEKNYMNLTLFEQEDTFLQELVASLSKEIQFQKTSLYEDIRTGTAHIKKLKQEHQIKNNSNGQKGKYSFDKPPPVFIRRAVDSSDEEVEVKPKAKQAHQKKKYKQAVKEQVVKPKFSNQDFPSLS